MLVTGELARIEATLPLARAQVGFCGTGTCRCRCVGKVLQPKSAEVEALSSGGSFAVELGRVYVLYYNKVHGRQNYATMAFVRRKDRKSGMLCT